MKRSCLLYFIIGTIALFSACKSDEKSESLYSLEAQAVVDSISDIDSLLTIAKRYASLKDKKAELIIHEHVGKLYRDRSNFEKAIIHHDAEITLATAIHDTLHLVRALNNQGTNFRRISDMNEAAKFHYEALELCNAQKDDTSQVARKNHVVSLNGLGNVLLSMGNYDEAENMFRQALAGEQSLGSKVGQAINYANIGSIFEHRNELDSARTYYIKSLKMNTEANNLIGIGLCHQYLGALDEKEGFLASAQKRYYKSYEVMRPTNDAWHWMEPCTRLAENYINIEEEDSARKYVGIITETAEDIKSKEHLAKAYDIGSRFEEKWGTPTRALVLYKMSQQLDDSVLSEKNFIQMQNMRVNYEAKQRAAEVLQAKEEARLEQTIRQIITWMSFAMFIILVAILIILVRVNIIRKKANDSLQKTDKELRMIYDERQEFYRDIAHRFRTPLTVVIGMTQQLREHINKEDKQAQGDFLAVERQNSELLRLVNEMMHKLQPNASTATSTTSRGKAKASGIVDVREDTYNSPTSTHAPITPEGNVPLILLAEDNEDVARYQCELLEGNGYRVNWVTDGLMALDAIKEEMPNIVITDVMMPKMDGLELCRHIREDEKTSHLPLIIVTARVEDRDRMEGLEAGAEVYLTKPFLGRELLLNIKNLLEQRHKLSQKNSNTATASVNSERTFAENEVSNIKEIVLGIIEEQNNSFRKMLNEVIDSNLSDPSFNSTMLAAHMCLSRAQLNRKVNAELGTDTTHYIRDRRLEHACQMLKKNNMSIMDVQVACGFDSPGYFSRVFKQKYNMSPSEYRKEA